MLYTVQYACVPYGIQKNCNGTVTAESLRVKVDPYVSVLEAREVYRCNNIFYTGRIKNQHSVPVESSEMVQG